MKEYGTDTSNMEQISQGSSASAANLRLTPSRFGEEEQIANIIYREDILNTD
jgi:hypothetical protein